MRSSLKPHLLLLLMLTFFCTKAIPQDSSRSLIDKIISLPDKVFAKVDKQAASFEEKLTVQTKKYLNRLERQEQKLKRKLWETDSVKAKEIFGDIKGRYDALRNSMKLRENKVQDISNVYNGHIDSVGTAMKFLQTNPQLIQGTGAIQKIGTNIQNITNLQNRFNQTELIRKQIQERHRYLKDQLQYTGLAKEFRKFRKEVFYYQQQLREYKEVLNNPDKLGKRLLETAMKFPAFQNFFRQNSELASLFALPGGSTNPASMQASFAGLQTRAGVQQQMMNQFGTQLFTAPTGGGASLFQQQLQAAREEIQKLKDKVNNYGGNSDDMEIPDFKTNPNRTKTFLQRIEFGTNFQNSRGNRFFPITTDIGFSAGYKMGRTSVVGAGLSYKIGWGQGWDHIRISHQGAGVRTFADIEIKGGFWISGGGEMNYRAAFRRIEVLKDYSAWQRSALLGVSKTVEVKSKFFKKTKMQLLYDFLWKQQRPQTQPILLRVCYNIK